MATGGEPEFDELDPIETEPTPRPGADRLSDRASTPCPICCRGVLERAAGYRTTPFIAQVGQFCFVIPSVLGLGFLVLALAGEVTAPEGAGSFGRGGPMERGFYGALVLAAPAAALILWGVIGLLLSMPKVTIRCSQCGVGLPGPG